MDNYIVVLPEGGLTSKERADQISFELWAISRPIGVRPANETTKYLFGRIHHPATDNTDPNFDMAAIPVDLDYMIYVHPENNLDALLALFPEVPEEERNQLSTFIGSSANNKFRFGDIIPSTATVRPKSELEAAGWFPADDLV